MHRIRLLTLALCAAGTTLAAQTPPQADTAHPAAAGPAVEAVLTRGLNGHEPADTVTTVPDSVGALYLWTRVSGAAGDTVHHVWFHGDTQVADVALAVGGSPWRTWSKKTIPSDWTGAWRVEVRDASGAVLKRVDFTVGP